MCFFGSLRSWGSLGAKLKCNALPLPLGGKIYFLINISGAAIRWQVLFFIIN
jgi:hypothetical protein